MIDFTLSEEQQVLRDLARDFARNRIARVAPELDREQRRSDEIVEECYRLGLLHHGVTKEYGGEGRADWRGI